MPNEINTTTNNTNTFLCDCCDETLAQNIISNEPFDNDERVCVDCLDSNYRYSERREYYVHNDNWDSSEHDYDDDDEEQDIDSNVLNYTARVSTRRRKKDYEKITNDLLFLGIENEVQIKSSCDLSRYDVVDSVLDDLDGFVICKNDSSIGYGFEIVSSPATFDYHKTAWDKFFSNSARHLRSYRDQSCGLHIHVNRTFFPMVAVGKLLEFINSDINKLFLDKVAHRVSTSYCFRDNKLKIKNVHSFRDRGALHIFVHHVPTHEFRLFSGNVKKESFFVTLEFVHALCHFIKYECININPNYRDFVSYAKNNSFAYPYLFNWLIKSRFITKKQLGRLKAKTVFYKTYNKKGKKVCV
jgi:hypothetical protein